VVSGDHKLTLASHDAVAEADRRLNACLAVPGVESRGSHDSSEESDGLVLRDSSGGLYGESSAGNVICLVGE